MKTRWVISVKNQPSKWIISLKADSLSEMDRGIAEGESHFHDEKWTGSAAVGTEAFVTGTKDKLGVKAKGREVIGGDGSYELRESPASYKGILDHENDGIR